MSRSLSSRGLVVLHYKAFEAILDILKYKRINPGKLLKIIKTKDDIFNKNVLFFYKKYSNEEC